jgi:hypothetical protein
MLGGGAAVDGSCFGRGFVARRRRIRLGATGAGSACVRGGGPACEAATAGFRDAGCGASAGTGPASRRSRRAANDGRLSAGFAGDAGAPSSTEAGGGEAGLGTRSRRGAGAGRVSRRSRRGSNRGRSPWGGRSDEDGSEEAGSDRGGSVGGEAAIGSPRGEGEAAAVGASAPRTGRSGGLATRAAGRAGPPAFAVLVLASTGVPAALGRGEPEAARRTRLSALVNSPDFGFAARGSAAATARARGVAGVGLAMRWTAGRRRGAAGCTRRGVTTGLATGSRGSAAGWAAARPGTSTTAGGSGSASGSARASRSLSGAARGSSGGGIASGCGERGSSGGVGVRGAGSAVDSAGLRWTRGGGVGAPGGLLATRKRETSSTRPRGTGPLTWIGVFGARRCSVAGAVRCFGDAVPGVGCRAVAGALSARESGGETASGRAGALAIDAAESDSGIAFSGSSSPKIHCAAKSLRPPNEIGSGLGGSRRR